MTKKDLRPDELFDAIRKLYEDDVLRKRLAVNAYNKVTEHLLIDKIYLL